MGMLRNKISIVGIIVLLTACSGPLIQVFQSGLQEPEVSLSFRSPFTGGLVSQGRFLLPEMAGGTLRVSLERLDQKKVIFRQDMTPQASTGGFLEARARVKVPINVEFRIIAAFLNPEGVEVSRADGVFSVGKNQTALTSPIYLLPTENFPGLLPLSAGGSLAENLIVEDGKSKVVALTVEEESSGKPRKVQWTGGSQPGDILVVLKDAQGAPVEFTWLNDNPAEGLVFTPQAGGTYFIIVHNQPPAEAEAPPVSVDLGRPSVPVSLTYDGNGATGGTVPAPQPSVLTGQALGVPGPGDLVKEGLVFSGWNTRADGTGDAYQPGETFTVGRVDAVLYAQWKDPLALKVKVVYQGNQETSGTPPTGSVDLDPGVKITVASEGSLVKTGFVFLGWNTRSDGTGDDYLPGAQVTLGGTDLVLFARWADAKTVTGTLKVGFTLSQPVYKVVNFESRSVTIPRTGSVDLRASDSVLAAISTGWAWYVDGTKEKNQSGPSYRFQGDIQGVGDHIVTVTITLDGVAYSGDLKITVTPAAEEGVYTLTYSSRGADGGSAPVDLKEYSEGSPVVLLTSTLTKGSYRFLGWKTSADGTGVVHYPGESLSMPAQDLTLYPVWEDMVAVPGGTFQRNGNSEDLSVVSSFLMGRFAVTRSQWKSVMGSLPADMDDSNKPIGSVSWGQALAYCNTLSTREGLEQVYDLTNSTQDLSKNGYRLPTQMEYLWAAMGGLSDSIPGNVEKDINVGGYLKKFAGEGLGGSREDFAWTSLNSQSTIKNVGTRLPNEWKIHDLTGNTFQWIWDNASPPPSGPLVNYASDNTGNKIHKGGTAFRNDGSFLLRSTDFSNTPSDTWKDVGFRVVRNAPAVAWVPRAGLVGEWKMDGNAQAATGQSGVVYGATAGLDRKGNAGGSLEFTPSVGKKSSMVLGYTPLGLGTPSNFTLSFWVMTTRDPDSLPHGQNLFVQDTSGANISVNLNANNRVSYHVNPISSGLSLQLESSTKIQKNTWYQVTITRQGTAIKIYLNGVLDSEASNATATFTGTNPEFVAIGQNATGDGSIIDHNWDLYGKLDDLRIYNRALTAAEVLALSKE